MVKKLDPSCGNRERKMEECIEERSRLGFKVREEGRLFGEC